jgi:LmbE family N-acetylglucosaminyl deacetylase
MTESVQKYGKVLAIVAHPDDETIAFGGMLQRSTASLVIFAVDGAPPNYGFEKRFGSLRTYSDLRFREASRALGLISNCSFRRLARENGSWFVDQHLFLELPEAYSSLCRIAREFSPDLVVSHSFEGGHLDHDACHVLAKRLVMDNGIASLEFPLYWRSANGRDAIQQFRGSHNGEFALRLSPLELAVKKRMIAEYRTQQNLVSVFSLESERFRPLIPTDCTMPTGHEYPFENSRSPRQAALFFKKIAEFRELTCTSVPSTTNPPAFERPSR